MSDEGGTAPETAAAASRAAASGTVAPETAAPGARAGVADRAIAGYAGRRVAAVLAMAAATALAARAAVPLPGTPVPFTLQPVAVLLAGLLLGPRLGAASQALYVAVGLAGAPVFAAGGGAAYLLGPTGGYLLAFPIAAALAGGISWRAGSGAPGLALRAAGLVVALAAIHLGGAAWLSITTDAEAAIRAGVTPFLAGDALKVVLVLLIGHRLVGPTRRLLGLGS